MHISSLRLGWLVLATALLPVVGCVTSDFAPQVTRSPAIKSNQIAPPGIGTLSQRPFSDFLSKQGSTSLFFPPFPDFIGWSNNGPQTAFAAVDYTGLVASYLAAHGGPNLGTAITGTVSERALADGRAEVTVVIHGMNAMSWAVRLPGDFANDPPIFGYRQGDLLANPSLKAALSSFNMKVSFS